MAFVVSTPGIFVAIISSVLVTPTFSTSHLTTAGTSLVGRRRHGVPDKAWCRPTDKQPRDMCTAQLVSDPTAPQRQHLSPPHRALIDCPLRRCPESS
ncbi:hypothetical protein HPB47_026192 [Ixodes persulcatus]|uniref:Uncharacterized protein n=1 Tax=Ixodes persulcatus TaxID=34615 RepID=A0AC60PZE8_IXOPE|nr:hypothetical protein HPB47_026192 [Ixodes persulcatus]